MTCAGSTFGVTGGEWWGEMPVRDIYNILESIYKCTYVHREMPRVLSLEGFIF